MSAEIWVANLTALDARAAGVAESEERGVGEVVVHELPPLHHIVRVHLARGVHVGNDVDAALKLDNISTPMVAKPDLMSLGLGRFVPPPRGVNTPSWYWGSSSRWKGVLAAPHSGVARELQLPS